MRKAIVLASLALSFAGCGDNTSADDDGGSTIDAAVPDSAPPDAISCPTRPNGQVGGGCTSDAECDSAVGAGDGICLHGTIGPTVFAAEGYCYIDNLQGDVCAIDADCGEGNLCVDSAGYKYCLPICDCAGNTCPDHQECSTNFLGFDNDQAACVPGTA